MTGLLSVQRPRFASYRLSRRLATKTRCKVVRTTTHKTAKTKEVNKVKFRAVIEKLEKSKIDPLKRLCENKDIVTDCTESKTELLCRTIPYAAFLAFYGRKTSSELASLISKQGSDGEPPIGIVETLANGTSVHHLHKDALENSMACIVKIHLNKATNVVSRDECNLFGVDSDPFVVFKHGMSMAKSKSIKDSNDPVWNSDHYLFIRKERIHKKSDDKLEIFLFDQDPHLLFWKSDHSLDDLEKIDDLIAHTRIELDLNQKCERFKEHTLKFDTTKSKSAKEMTLNFSTQVLSVEEFCEEMEQCNRPFWSNVFGIGNSKLKDADWAQILGSTTVPYTPMYPYTYFDVPSTDTQAWIFGNVKEKIMVLSFPAADVHELKDIFTNFNTRESTLEGIVEDEYRLDPKKEFTKSEAQVHSGFKEAYVSIREILLESMFSLTNWSKNWLIVVTGHSLGGALSALASYEIANRTKYDGVQPDIAMFSFGAPAVGNPNLCKSYAQSVPAGFRCVYQEDIIAWLLQARFDRVGKAVPADCESGDTLQTVLDADCDPECEGAVEEDNEEDTESLLSRFKAFGPEQLMKHDEGSYFDLIKKLMAAINRKG